MSDDLKVGTRLRIEPEPTEMELVAILATLQRVEIETIDELPEPSRWMVTARREQLRTELSAPWSGWNR